MKMTTQSLWIATLAVTLVSAPMWAPAATAAETGHCAVVDIDRVGWAAVEAIRRNPGVSWWVELDDRLLVCGTPGSIEEIAAGHRLVARLDHLDGDHLLLARGRTPADLESSGFRVIAASGGHAVVETSTADLSSMPFALRDHPRQPSLAPLPPDTVALRQQANAPPRPKTVFAPEVQALVDEVNGDRWFGDVVTLASTNRWTHGIGIHDARDWLASRFQALPNVTVTTPSFSVSGTTAYNVVARLDGALGSHEWYVIGGHYDSTSQNPSVAAPGAEDNASGCAGVLEMARILTAFQPRATVLFICYSGEEQGLYGSEDHVASLIASGDLPRVQAMLDMDMIGFTSDPDLDCLLETDPFAQSILVPFADAAAEYTDLRIVTSLFAWGSDHVPYLDAGVPALLTIENDWDEYPDYHRTTDLPANLTIAMAEETLKMNVGALAALTGAESGRLFADGFESGGVAAWNVSEP